MIHLNILKYLSMVRIHNEHLEYLHWLSHHQLIEQQKPVLMLIHNHDEDYSIFYQPLLHEHLRFHKPILISFVCYFLFYQTNLYFIDFNYWMKTITIFPPSNCTNFTTGINKIKIAYRMWSNDTFWKTSCTNLPPKIEM